MAIVLYRNVSVEPDEEQQPGVSASGGVGSSGVGDRGSDSQDKDLSPAMQVFKSHHIRLI